MDKHGIATSVLSLANPWLDFLPASESPTWARTINQELEGICASSNGRIFAFGTLPVTATSHDICDAVDSIKGLPHLKGVIMGTSGLGDGLDDPNLEALYAALEHSQVMVFLHPHYGLPNPVFGPKARESGHILPLSLGFPLETTVAFTRMYLNCTFDRFPRLRVLISHA